MKGWSDSTTAGSMKEVPRTCVAVAQQWPDDMSPYLAWMMTRKIGRPSLAARCLASSNELVQSRRYIARSWSLGRNALYFCNTVLACGSCAVAMVHATSVAQTKTICHRTSGRRFLDLRRSLAANIAFPNGEAMRRSTVTPASYTFETVWLSELLLHNDVIRPDRITVHVLLGGAQ